MQTRTRARRPDARPGVGRGIPHPFEKFVTAGDELLEEAGSAGEQVCDDEGLFALDDGEARFVGPRAGSRGRSASFHATGAADL